MPTPQGPPVQKLTSDHVTTVIFTRCAA